MPAAIDEKETVREQSRTERTAVDACTTRSSSCDHSSDTTSQRHNPWTDKLISLRPSHLHGHSRPWTVTLFRLGPLSGVFSMVLAAGSLVASLGILAGSDRQRVDVWSAQPATYLAIFTAIANLSMRYAAFQGFVIAWWVKALRGSTMSHLHQSWRSGTSLRGAINAGRSMGLLGLACIFSTLVTIDGPLLQRASKVYNVPNHGIVPINVTMSPELPRGFTATWETAAQASITGTKNSAFFNSTVPTVNGSAPNNLQITMALPMALALEAQAVAISGIARGCPGSCAARIRAPALFPSSCSTRTIPANPWIKYDYESVAENLFAPPLETFGFLLTSNLLVEAGEREGIDLITGAATYDANCTGTLVLKVCTLQAGIGEYNVLIENNRIDADILSLPDFFAFANNTAVDLANFDATLGGHPSTVGSIQILAERGMQSMVQYFNPGGADDTDKTFLIGFHNAEISYNYAHYARDSGCPPNYGDPYDLALTHMNQWMFRFGAAAAAMHNETYLQASMDPGLSIYSTVEGYLQGSSNVYHTNYWWFLGAAVVEVICILFVIPTYWGWWRIGRTASFSPLELAKAFESPLLAQCNSNSTGNDLARQTSEKIVRYGHIAADTAGAKSKLAFGDLEVSSPPSSGARFDI